MNVLIVDDEKDVLKLFVKRFNHRGLNSFGAGSGMEALEFLENNEVDVVVLDVMMPGMDGLQTLKEIKKRHPLVEVIMLTGHASVESGIQGMILGAYDYLMKPFDIDDLLGRINKAGERRTING